MKIKDIVGASSATYRKAVNKISDVLNLDPHHTKYPSEDFESAIELIDEESRKRALKWYKRGLRRGFEEACDAVVNGDLELKGDTLYCPSKVVISVRVKFRGMEAKDKEFEFTADELGFK